MASKSALLFFVGLSFAVGAACANGTDPSAAGGGGGDPGGGGGGGTSRDAAGGADDDDSPSIYDGDGSSSDDVSSNRDGATTSDAGGKDTGTTLDTGSTADVFVADTGAPDTAPPVDSGPTCAKAPPNNVCGVVPQCGCPSGQTCDVTNDTTGATSCVAAGTSPNGAACTNTTQCATGLTCSFDACRTYCSTPGNPCPGMPGTECFSPQTASGATTPNRNVCTVTCDPRTPGTACGTNGCLWFPTDKVSDCRAQGTKLQTDPCTYPYECSRGYTCAQHPVFGLECERWCRLGPAYTDCGSLYTCTDEYGANAPVIGGTRLGVCQD